MTDNYLADFLEPTPLALLRIKILWNDLPFESKVKILKTLLNMDGKNKSGFQYNYQVNQLKDLALNDENPYIRYLVAQTVSKPYKWGDGEETDQYREDDARYKRVLADKSELVRSVAEEGLRGFPKDNDETAALFWNLSHAKRLLSVSSKEPFDRLGGEVVAKILEYAAIKLLPEGKISEQEIMDVIQQYIAGESMKERVRGVEKYAREFMDGYAEYSLGKDMEALWRTAFLLPDTLGFDLIENLPVKAGFMSNIPVNDLEKLSKHKLVQLFYRDDVDLNELRRRFYTETPSKENDHLRSAAISSLSFKLEDDDFKKLTIKEDDTDEEAKLKLKELRTLAQHCRGATLAQMEAIMDLLEAVPDKYFPGLSHSGEDIAFARRIREGRARSLGNRFRQEYLDWRIYALATYLVRGHALDSFNFLKGDVVPGDSWATYLKIRPKVINKTKLHNDMPFMEIEGLTANDAGEYEDEDETEAENLTPSTQASWEPHLKILEKKVKWIFWIAIATLILLVSQY